MEKASLTKEGSRRKIIGDSLKFLEADIKNKIGEKTVLIKPNFVSTAIQTAASHIDQIRGILDFLSGFYTGKVVIAEGAAGDTFEGFKNFGYFKLKEEYDFPILLFQLRPLCLHSTIDEQLLWK